MSVPCEPCKGTGRANGAPDVDCPTCDGTGIDLEHQLAELVKLGPSAALATVEPLTPGAIATLGRDAVDRVPRIVHPEERIGQVDTHSLIRTFEAMANLPPPPLSAENATMREREAIGRAIAEYMTAAERGEDADVVAERIVGAVGAVEAHHLADVLSKWALAISVRAEKAERLGLGRT